MKLLTFCAGVLVFVFLSAARAQTSADSEELDPELREDASADTAPADSELAHDPRAPDEPAAPSDAALHHVLRQVEQASQAAKEAAAAAAQASAMALRYLCTGPSTMEGCKTAEQPQEGESPEIVGTGAKEDDSPPFFSGNVGASLISVSGNANALSGKLQLGIDLREKKWLAQLRANAAYGQASLPDTDPQITAHNADARLYAERRFGNTFVTYASVGGATDRVASIAYQAYGEPGVGILWFEELGKGYVRSRLKTDLGFRYTREDRFQYYPTRQNLEDLDIYALRVGLNFLYALAPATSFEQTLEILPDLIDKENIRGTAQSRISAQVYEQLALTLSFNVRYIGSPAEGRQPVDTELAAGLTYSF